MKLYKKTTNFFTSLLIGLSLTACGGGGTKTPPSTPNNPTPPSTTQDTTPPTITIKGTPTMYLAVGDTFTDLGATAQDDTDGDISSKIITAGDTVDNTTKGTYTITYNVKDTAGNPAIQVTRIVMVNATNTPTYNTNAPWVHGKLKVSTDGHMIQHEDGSDFFWMGDTAWYLPVALTEAEIGTYFQKRKEQGFNVIAFTAVKNIVNKNLNGDFPFKTNNDSYAGILRENIYKDFNEPYWKYIDKIIQKAEDNGLYIAFLPSWNMDPNSTTTLNGLSTEGAATQYGETIAKRYEDKKNIIWVIGGDSAIKDDKKKKIWNALANAIHTNAKVKANHLMTYHPSSNSSSKWFHGKGWLDFNMIQSGHCHSVEETVKAIKTDYNKSPAKPILDIEPRYEDIEECYYYRKRDEPEKVGPAFVAKDIREVAYKEIFLGTFGFNYGHNSVWQFFNDTGTTGKYDIITNRSWKEALKSDGAKQMGHLVKLIRSRPILGRVPDQSIISQGDDAVATKGTDYIFVYLPKGGEVTLNLGKISGAQVKAWWYDPKTGEATAIDTLENTGTKPFKTGNQDMVLVLDDASKGYAAPGQ